MSGKVSSHITGEVIADILAKDMGAERGAAYAQSVAARGGSLAREYEQAARLLTKPEAKP